MTASENLIKWSAKASEAEAILADLQALYDAELPNREAGNGAEAARIFGLMRGVKRDMENARKQVAEANAWLAKSPTKGQ